MKPGGTFSQLSRLAPLLYFVIAGVGWLVLGRVYEADANFVAYRFAMNLAAGRGLVYWTSGLAASTYPLVPALLALIALPGVPLLVAGGIVSASAAAVGAITLTRLAGERWMAGLAYVLVVIVQPSPVVLTMLALGLAGLDAARNRRWWQSGALIGLAILAEPSAIALAALTLILVLRLGGSIWRYLAPVVLIPAAVLAGLGFSLRGLTFASVVPGLVTLALPVVAIPALVRRWPALREAPHFAILLAWSAITVLIAFVGGALPTAAILPGLIALAALLPLRPLVLAAACADLVFGVLLAGQFAAAPSSEVLGRWIAANTGPETTVATADIGALAFYAARPVIDLSGKLQPESFDATFFIRRVPDAIVLRDGTAVPWPPFATTYARTQATGGRAVYQRVINFSPLNDHGVDVKYGVAALERSDMRLTNVALGNTLHPGDLVRIRLDWELTYLPLHEVRIKLTLLNEQGLPIVGASDPVPRAAWQIGKMSTYHLLVLPNNAASGRASLYLGVALGDTASTELSVAVVNVAR